MEKEIGRVIPLGGDEQGTMVELPTIMDGKIRADAMVAEVMRNQRDKPDLPDEAIAALELPGRRPEGITIEIDSTERHIIVHFKGKVVAVLRWARSVGKFLVKRHLQAEKGVQTNQPVQYFTNLVGVWAICREYGISVSEFQQAFREMPPQVQWTFEQCPWHSMDCKLVMAGDPQSTAVPDIACRTCKARFGMDEKGALALKMKGEDPRPSLQESVPDIFAKPPPEPRFTAPSAPFAEDFRRYRYATQSRLSQLADCGLDSWEALAQHGATYLRSKLGWKKAHADEFEAIAKEKIGH
jgi:hypothetical protein